MKRWMEEDWEFEVTVTRGQARSCRLGLEQGDKFTFQYECPANFCPRAMMEIFTWCEVIRCGGDFSYRGSLNKYELDMECPCKSLSFRLKATPINRDEDGVYVGESIQPD